MIKFLVILTLFLHSLISICGNDNFPMGARSWGLGNASLTLVDEWAVFNNIAMISELKTYATGFFFEDRFGLEDLRTMAAAIAIPHLKWGSAGIGFYRFGSKIYSEQKIGLGYAKNIKGINVGFQLDFLQIKEDLSEQDDGIQTKNSLAYEFGIATSFISKVKIAAHVYNFTRTLLAEYDSLKINEKIPTIFKAGISYTPFEKLIIAFESEKDLDFDANFKAGVEYLIIKQLALRTGISTEPFMGYYGLGIHLQMVSLDYALNNHLQLGLSHHISATFRFGNIEKSMEK